MLTTCFWVLKWAYNYPGGIDNCNAIPWSSLICIKINVKCDTIVIIVLCACKYPSWTPGKLHVLQNQCAYSSVRSRLSTDTYYRPRADHLSTTTKIEVCMLSWVLWVMGHRRRVDTCICATTDSTSIGLESVHCHQQLTGIMSRKCENVSPIFISACSLQPGAVSKLHRY